MKVQDVPIKAVPYFSENYVKVCRVSGTGCTRIVHRLG